MFRRMVWDNRCGASCRDAQLLKGGVVGVLSEIEKLLYSKFNRRSKIDVALEEEDKMSFTTLSKR